MTVAGTPGAPKRQLHLGADRPCIDIDDSSGHPFHSLKRFADVPGVYRGRKPVSNTVIDRNGLLQVRAPDYVCHRPKDLLLGDAHCWLHLREYRRLEEVPVVQPISRGPPASACDSRAFVSANLHVSTDLLERQQVDDRPNVGLRRQAVAKTQGLRAADKPIGERRLYAGLDDHPASRSTALPAGAERAPHSSFHGKLEVGVVENEDRVLAAHFEVDTFVVATAIGADLPADFE